MSSCGDGAFVLQIPLIGWIGRLDHQKGPDIVLDAAPGFAARSCQVRPPPCMRCCSAIGSFALGRPHQQLVWS